MNSVFKWVGNVFIIGGLIIFIFTFGPLVVQEATYKFRPPDYYQLADGPRNEVLNTNPDKIITPTDTDFGIVIPKINANSSIIEDVDPNNANVYQRALTKGVAHALGSSLPNATGNVFLFSHSAGNFWEAGKYNAVFYLLSKMEAEDDIYLYHKGRKYHYVVTGKKSVSPADVSYLSSSYKTNSLTLMTCWPAGTTFKRIIVEAQKQPS